MAALIHVVLFVAALIAFIAWSIAALNAMIVTRVALPGEKLSTYFKLGLWKFTELEARLGPGIAPHVARYKRAFLIFFATIGAILVVSISSLFVKSA